MLSLKRQTATDSTLVDLVEPPKRDSKSAMKTKNRARSKSKRKCGVNVV